MVIPGIGAVTQITELTIEYRYLPLIESVPKDRLASSLTPIEKHKFDLRRFPAYWQFELSKESFVKTVGESLIAWP